MLLFFYIFLILHVRFHHHHFTMGKEEDFAVIVNSTSILENFSRNHNQPLPIQSHFRFPSPLPAWPHGEGFGSAVIDFGGLQVCQVSTFETVWASFEGGLHNVGATFFEPSIPNGYFMLGSYTQPNNIPLFGWVLVAKDSSPDQSILRNPIDYTLVWSSESVKINQDGVGYIWHPIPPDGYKSVGHVVTRTSGKPPLDKIRCVHADFTDEINNGEWIWGNSDGGLNVYTPRPSNRGPGASGVPAGTFLATINGGSSTASQLACLKNVAADFSSMPNLSQIEALMQEYSPRFYFHPDESFLPSSVNWFFQNGALLYTKGQENNPVPVSIDGSNLPPGGSNDGKFWIDLPADGSKRDEIKQGSLQGARVYLHIKPMFGSTFTDICVWVFYPFNGAARVKIGSMKIQLGQIGEHVGDWEHVTLRISNFNGELKRVYFSQHSGGTWVESYQLEYQPNGNKPVFYSSLNGHAAYPNASDHLQRNGNGNGGNGIWIRDDTGKGDKFLDIGDSFEVVCADYLGPIVVEPPWLSYARQWGPKISYQMDDELRKVKKWLPRWLQKAFDEIVKRIPEVVLGEKGPIGPKWRGNWDGDEIS